METPDDKPKNKGGRPAGSFNKFSSKARAMAEATGELPHEFLLRVARGELIKQKQLNPETNTWEDKDFAPPWEDRMDAAKAAAPYFAPKFATVEVIKKAGDDELDQIIASLAAEAGIGLSPHGEAEEAEGAECSKPVRRRLTPKLSNGDQQ